MAMSRWRSAAVCCCHRQHAATFNHAFASKAEQLLSQLVNHEQHGLPQNAGVDGLDLAGMHRLLAELGDPHQCWPVVHVAGTKGKGSLAAMLSSILRCSGYRVGTYTSPHLLSVTERIQVDGHPIPQQALDTVAEEHGSAVKAADVTHFEALTALAFRHFADQQVDVVVVEAGLGGTTDATNVFESGQKRLSVITPIGLDHVEALGGSLESIATAKAGILRPGVPALVAPQPHIMAEKALLEAADRLLPPPPIMHTSVAASVVPSQQAAPSGQQAATAQWQPPFWPAMGHQEPFELQLKLLGRHQLDNAATAMAAAAMLQQDMFNSICHPSVVRGLQQAWLPGRCQVARLISDTSIHAADSPPIMLDGAHTRESAEAFADAVHQQFPGAAVALVLAMAADKDPAVLQVLRERLRPDVALFTAVPIAGSMDRSASSGQLAAEWARAGMALKRPKRCRELVQASMRAALMKAQNELLAQQRQGVIALCGSLHAVAAALPMVEPLPAAHADTSPHERTARAT